METAGKYIIPITGPLMAYRLGIYKKVCPDIKEIALFATDKFSYDNNFTEYHDDFNFIILDEYRKDNLVSLDYERIIECKTESEFYEKSKDFYGHKTNRWYPLDWHRFIFPYMIENGILNFNITQSDLIFVNDINLLNNFFKQIPVGTVYGPWHGEDNSRDNRMKVFESIQPNFPQIKLDSPFLRTCDGWMRGFHFRNVDEMKLFYDIWNSAIDIVLMNNLNGHGGGFICQTEWVISYIFQFYEHQFGYNFHDCFKYILVANENREIGRHFTRVEDTLYSGIKEGWNHCKFDWSDMSSIKNFIKNNKQQLKNFYDGTFDVEVTDDFVYTYKR